MHENSVKSRKLPNVYLGQFAYDNNEVDKDIELIVLSGIRP